MNNEILRVLAPFLFHLSMEMQIYADFGLIDLQFRRLYDGPCPCTSADNEGLYVIHEVTCENHVYTNEIADVSIVIC